MSEQNQDIQQLWQAIHSSPAGLYKRYLSMEEM